MNDLKDVKLGEIINFKNGKKNQVKMVLYRFMVVTVFLDIQI